MFKMSVRFSFSSARNFQFIVLRYITTSDLKLYSKTGKDQVKMFIILQIAITVFLIDNAHLMYNAYPKLFRHSFWCLDNAHDAK
jgi:hypothetical protein